MNGTGEVRSLSVAIPTYRREQVLLDTLEYLAALRPAAAEILVLDQTERHETRTGETLAALDESGRIRWVRLPEPSIANAMNRGLQEAQADIVLFLDDDIRPEAGLVEAHAMAHSERRGVIVAGRVIQPWEEGQEHAGGGAFRFAGTEPAWIGEFMGGNFSVPRELALAVGGFDENFVRAAYRFEAEFAHRWREAGHRIYFLPAACVHHLKAGSGGTRSYGEYLTTLKPDHAVGAYYYLLRTKRLGPALRSATGRFVKSVATRHHLRRPWWIPATLIAELRGLAWAVRLAFRGPRLIGKSPRNA